MNYEDVFRNKILKFYKEKSQSFYYGTLDSFDKLPNSLQDICNMHLSLMGRYISMFISEENTHMSAGIIFSIWYNTVYLPELYKEMSYE